MTLKEQIEKILIKLGTNIAYLEHRDNAISKLESLIESEAVGFCDWVSENYVLRVDIDKYWWEEDSDEDNQYTTAELYKLKSKQDGI